ncbi:hypothetical protein [Mycolicibacterium moriokaense]|nr:hypothetical protein [Mycolicibacterium moriokaense]
MIHHELDPEQLRALTGTVGGADEVNANTGQLVSLVAELKKL